ncbi:uncharacterized protein [Aegilops tauschii subsp. strangulata]|uniref:uncharacterized protein n=1 Tax=Aegilops tauschii subsp. strangulata TaxID=200361 RepID=UPI003CC8A0E6
MRKFKAFVDNNELKELYMHGRRFTWSNERDQLVMTKIDQVLVSVDWELNFPDVLLQALSSNISDHAPLHLSTSAPFCPKRRFRFEIYWTRLEGFEQAVKDAWVCEDDIADPFKRLNALLRNTASALQAWGQRKIGNIKIQMAIANYVILRLDRAMESRDANTKLFQAVANGRRTKNFIPHIRHNGELVSQQERNEEIFSDAYEQLLGQALARDVDVDLSFLDMAQLDLSELDTIFTEEEVWSAIKEMHPERAPGPDGFTAAFYQKVWPIIKHEIMAVFLKLYVGDGRGFGKLNRAHIVLIPKKPDAEEVGDFRPISLPHSVAKIFAKLLAMRARRRMKEIVTTNQSAFICGRHLHDNFLLVRQVARKLHARKADIAFLKLDITRLLIRSIGRS